MTSHRTFPPVGPKSTLLVKSKTCGKLILPLMVEGQRDRAMLLVQCTSMALEIGRPQLNQQSQSLLYKFGE